MTVSISKEVNFIVTVSVEPINGNGFASGRTVAFSSNFDNKQFFNGIMQTVCSKNEALEELKKPEPTRGFRYVCPLGKQSNSSGLLSSITSVFVAQGFSVEETGGWQEEAVAKFCLAVEKEVTFSFPKF